MAIDSADWKPDPWNRFQYRWFDGLQWTAEVATDGTVYSDPPVGPPPTTGPTMPVAPPAYQSGPAPIQPMANPQQPLVPGAPMQQPFQPQMMHSYQQVVVTAPKSKGLAFVLTFFFGPFGMFYSTVSGALIMLLVSFFVAVFTLGFGLIITWPICIIWGIIACDQPATVVHSQHFTGH